MPQFDPVDVELGRRVKALRTARRISQTALGDALGVSFQQTQKYERGSNRISVGALLKICAALGVQVADITDGLDGGGAGAVPPVNPALLQALDGLSPGATEFVLVVAKTLKEKGL